MAARSISLRPETPDDRVFLRDLYADHRADELRHAQWPAATKAGFLDQQFAAQDAHLRATRPNADRLIVLRGSEPVGRLYVDRSAEPWRLVEIGLLVDVARQGIGAMLVAWLLDRAREARCPAIDLHVTHENLAAIAFYRRLGFVDATSLHATHRRMIRTL